MGEEGARGEVGEVEGNWRKSAMGEEHPSKGKSGISGSERGCGLTIEYNI